VSWDHARRNRPASQGLRAEDASRPSAWACSTATLRRCAPNFWCRWRMCAWITRTC